jgi:hypothetical protein
MSVHIALAAAIGAVAAAVVATGGQGAGSACSAALVHYEWNARAQGGPWIAVGSARTRLEGHLFSYVQYLGDGRVNRSDRVVLRAGRQEKIAWFSKAWGGRLLRVSGRRLDGPGSFTRRFRAAVGAGWYPSGVVVPVPGCWQLTLRTDGWTRRLVVQAVAAAPEDTCDATPLREDGWLKLTPARSGVSAWWPWRTLEGGALLFAGGRSADGQNAKVLWRARRSGGQLVVRGTRLDGVGEFRQSFNAAGSPSGYWPSTVVVPEPGCWLLTVRILGQTGAAGIVVTRVLAP